MDGSSVLKKINDNYHSETSVEEYILDSNMSLKDYYKQVVEQDGDIIISNKELALKLLDIGESILEFLSKKLMKDRDIFQKAVKKYGYLKVYSFDKYKVCDEEIFLESLIEKDGFLAVPFRFRNRELCLKAVELHPYNFVYLSDEFENDREFVLKGVGGRTAVLEDIPDKMKNDKEIILKALEGFKFHAYSLEEIYNSGVSNYDSIVFKRISEAIIGETELLLKSFKNNF